MAAGNADRPRPYMTSDSSSFAYTTARTRWPVILTKVIDDLHKAIPRQSSQEAQSEGKTIIEQVAQLKYQVQHDRVLEPIIDDGRADVATWNQHLSQFQNPTWLDLPWLFLECYLYRRLYTILSTTTHWKKYDVFNTQKLDTYRTSRTGIFELAERFNEMTTHLSSKKRHADGSTAHDPDQDRQLFHEMCQICLWGNATDLSLLNSLSAEDVKRSQGAAAIKAAENNVILNDTDKVFDMLYATKMAGKAERRVDIVLDNAGFELYVDLVMSAYLLESGLATSVVLHPKDIPWFVSDVIPADFGELLSIVTNPAMIYHAPTEKDKADGIEPQELTAQEQETLARLAQNWIQFYASGQILLRPHGYWTLPTGFNNMPQVAPDVFADLQESELVIFKGDLNYRKLTEDLMWSSTTPFATALGALGAGSGVSTLALRTCKADVVVGLPDGLDEKLKVAEGGNADDAARTWSCNGKYAVVQYCNGR